MKMESRLNRRFLTAFALAAMVGMTACDDDDNGITPPPVDDPEPSSVEIFDEGERVATAVNSTWEGGIPPLQVGQTLHLGIVVLDEEGDTIQLGQQFTAQAMLADEAPEDIIEITNQTDSVTLTGLAAGETSMIIQVLDGTTVAYESPPLDVTVTEADPVPAGVQLRDRETNEIIAQTEGTGEEATWDGEMPTLEVDEALEVNVIFVNAAGQPIPLEEGESVGASVAEGESEDVVAIENADGFVILTGAAAGETALVFTRVQNDTQQFASPPIALVVTD
jgi:hypothetical protein